MSQDIATNDGGAPDEGVRHGTPQGSPDGSPGGTAHVAAQEASAVTHDAADAARGVVETGAHEAAEVGRVAKDRWSDLLSQSSREVSDQASTQQQRLAAGLGTVGDDLSRMADADENGGLAGELVRRTAGHVSTIGSWLGERDPQQLLQEVTGFARRRPGTFIAVAALAGVVVGRLSRAIAAGSASGSGSETAPTPAAAGPRYAQADAAARRAEPPIADTVDDTGLVAEVDGGDPPLFTESAARLDGARTGGPHERPDSL